MTSDGGALLLREADRLFEVSVRLGDVLPTTANFSAFAAVLVNIVRRIGLRGTTLVAARIDTIRSRLFKLAALIKVTARKVWLSFASPFPLQKLFT